MTLDWWPVAPDRPWAWHPAVHLGALVIALSPALIVILLAWRRRTEVGRREGALIAAATLVLVIALGWPLGDLAVVSLAARTTQYMLITLCAAPLLLTGVPRWRAAGRAPVRRALERALGSPILGAFVLASVVWTTHFTAVVDGIEASAAGEAAVRTTWLLAALVFWWPLVGPGPARERLPYLAGLAYLILPFAFPKFPAAVWIFATDPTYEAFVGLPRPGGLSATADQGLAGFILWLPGSVMVGVAIYLLIRHWVREDRRLTIRQQLGVPADPDAVALLVADPQSWKALEALIAIVDAAVPRREGADLAFAVRRQRVVLQVHFPGTEEEQVRATETIEGQYAAYLARFARKHADNVRTRLAVEVLPYGTRVQ